MKQKLNLRTFVCIKESRLMVVKKTVPLLCPKCGLTAVVTLNEKYQKFLIYTCPECKSNVVHYNKKVEVISKRLLSKLMRKGKLKFCGNVQFKEVDKHPQIGRVISKDDIVDLKILLETEQDWNKIILSL